VIDAETAVRTVVRSKRSFKYFFYNMFRLSFNPDKWVHPSHVGEWADILEGNQFTALLAPRYHLKSYHIYAYLMWDLLCNPDESKEWLYISFKQDLASRHLRIIKELIDKNPYFQCKDLTPAEGVLRYTWDGKNVWRCDPEGILSTKRGIHANIVADDILADPASRLNLTVIKRITDKFLEEVMSIPTKHDELHLVGTPQDNTDLFYQIRGTEEYHWSSWPALQGNKALWPELYGVDELERIKKRIKEKAFNKEFLLVPVRAEEAYFMPEQIMRTIRQATYQGGKTFMFWDLGKKRHPSHISIMELQEGKLVMVYQKWLDRTDYTVQLELVGELMERFEVDEAGFDATRGELDTELEQQKLPHNLNPVIFKVKNKFDMAACFNTRVEDGTISLLNDDRLISQILCVDNDLKAPETPDGHGDSFWTVAGCCWLSDSHQEFDWVLP